MTIKSTPLFYLFLPFLLYLLPYDSVGQNLVEQLPNTFIEDVLDVAMNPSGAGVAIAGRGKVLRTTDFGENWEEQAGSIFNTERVEAIPGTTNGFVLVLRATIQISGDGGQSWTIPTIPALTSTARLRRVSLPSANVFYVSSDDDILKSFDGGTSWTLLTPPAVDRKWTDLHFATETEGWLADDAGKLYYTTNGGNTWTILNGTAFTEGFVFDFLDDNIGYAAVFRDLYKSTDGGTTWQLILEGAFGSTMSQVEIISEQQIVFSQLALSDYVTADGGLTVDRISPLGYGGNHGYLTSLPDGRVWAGTDYGGLAFSTDGGLSYIDQLPGLKNAFLAMDISTDMAGWAAGQGGQIVRTNNGGELWTPVAGELADDPLEGEQPYIYYTRSFNYNEAFLAATRQLFYTNDGGTSWEVILEPMAENVRFKSAASLGNTIWAFQSDGMLFKSTDKGQSWTTSQVDPEPFTSLEDMYFVTENVGFIVSFNGSVFRSTNGGANWTELPSFTTERLQRPYFIDETEGWILVDGFSSAIFHTIDGGDNWETIETGQNGFWTSIHANEFGGIYLFGGSSGSGRVIRSLDGGASWEAFISENLTSYQDYAYASNDQFYSYWVCGFAGYIGRVDISLVSTREVFAKELAVYPNPSNGVVQLDIPANWEQQGSLKVTNLYGQLVREELATSSLDLSALAKGSYIIEVQYEASIYVGRLLIN